MTRDTLYLILFLVIAFVLLVVGRDVIARSVLLSWGLTFGGTTTAAILALALYRIRMALRASRQELAMRQAELSVARKVQQALFPRQLPTDSGLEISATCIPARGISGDYYDVLRLPEGRTVLAVADISGKGISAAILMANLQALLRVIASLGHAPGKACDHLNRYLHQATEASQYATLFYGEWHQATRKFTYVNAGHNPPLLVSRSGQRSLTEGGVPLGVMEDVRYGAGEAVLQPGDLLVIYSDGLPEAGLSKDREFGVPRLEQLVTGNADAPLAEIQAQLLGAVHAWTGGDFEDDLTLMLVRVLQTCGNGRDCLKGGL